MAYSAASMYQSALSNSWYVPGGVPVLQAGGTFQPTTNEQITIARASADEQFDATFIDQYRGAMQNRLQFLQGQLQQAYNSLLSSTSAAYVADGLTATDNKFLWNNDRGNGYTGYTNAFQGVGKQGLPDVDTDGKYEIAEGDQAVPIYSGISGQPGAVRFRSFYDHGAALDLKQSIGITMRSEEVSHALFPLSYGLNMKVKEYNTTVSEGGFYAGVNYLLAWRPSQMNYSYVDGYSQASDAAGWKGYLSQGQDVADDYGDGSATGSFTADKIKWQGGGFSEGYLATASSDVNNAPAFPFPDPGSDVGMDGNTGNDDYRFANTYYVRQRTVNIDPVAYNVTTFGNNAGGANSGTLSQVGSTLLNNHDDGLGYYDVVNGNVYHDNAANADLPGSGKIEETFNGNWIGRQIKINTFNGMTVDGNANNPVFGNFELGRFQAYWDPDDTLNNSSFINGTDVDKFENNNLHRMGQERQFINSTGNITYMVDQRDQDQNSFASYVLEMMQKPQYRDIFRLGLFKDVVIQGGANNPAGGTASGTLRLSWVGTPDWSPGVAKLVPGKGFRPGTRGEMIVFQDKYSAKGA